MEKLFKAIWIIKNKYLSITKITGFVKLLIFCAVNAAYYFYFSVKKK